MISATLSLVMAAIVAASSPGEGSTSPPQAENPLKSFKLGRYADLPDLERSKKIGADLEEVFPPGTPLRNLVRNLRNQGAACQHVKTGVIAEFKFGSVSKPNNTQEYKCEHEKKMGGLKRKTTNISIFFDGKTCAVTAYQVSAGTAFKLGGGTSVPLGKDPAAHCFQEDTE